MSNNEVMKLEEDKDLKGEFKELCKALRNNHRINPNLYVEYDVKRGLRDSAGKGVLTGLTEVSDVTGYNLINGRNIPAEGRLYYQGINVNDIVDSLKDRKFGFEETVYLLMFGHLPNKTELEHFLDVMFELQELSGRFVRDVVMKASNENIMNAMQRCVLTLYSYDENPDDISPENVLRQALELIAKLPLIAVYSYHSYRHFRKDEMLFIRNPEKGLSLAENILLMLRPKGEYTELEAKVLDIALVLHAEHGGGNNSTFTTHVVTSSGTDTYSTIAAAMASLKGPKHGGANVKVTQMFEDMKTQLTDWQDDDQIRAYLEALLEKRAFDKRGLIYGMGHAIYSVSDPRAEIFKKFVKQLAYEKGHEAEYVLYEKVEKMAPEIISERRKMYKGVNANVDFYSGLVYSMLDLPPALYTPIFAAARIVGWSAHRLEELKNVDKIIRPAYKPLAPYRDYIKLDDR